MSTSADPVLAPGERLAHYEIQDVLGAGAMGTVYRAHDTSLDRSVAVKVLRPRLAADPAFADRFVREARAAARVNHPNLTHVYFVGAERGSRFFAMEYVPGRSFEEEIAAGGPMDFAKFVDAIVQSARGLAAAHGVGVIHRDVKPSNLMLLPDGTVKVTDFGLAKSLGGDVAASGGGMLTGTPTYMAPEQCRGRPVDARTDVYALGLVAWFLLAGKPPYAGESIGQMIADQLNAPLPSICALRPELPAALDDVLAKLCDKDPEKRPATMLEVAALFEPLRPRPLEPATFMARASAFVIDGFAAMILSGFFELLGTITIPGGDSEKRLPHLVVGFVAAAASVAYFWGCEARFGQTIGKYFLNLHVVGADGAPAGKLRLLARYFARYPGVFVTLWPKTDIWPIVVLVSLQGAAMVLGAAVFVPLGRRTLSDWMTRTRVVYRGDKA